MQWSWSTFIFEIVNFLVFLWLLQRLLYKPLQQAIERRREAHASAKREIAELREHAERLKAEQTAARAAIDDERRRAVELASSEAQQARATILARARSEAEDLRRRETERLAVERRDLEALTARHSLDAARAVTESLLRSLDAPDASLLARLQGALDAQGAPQTSTRTEVELCTANELDAEGRAQFERGLGPRLGSNIVWTFTSDDALIGGAQLRVADRVYDASLRAQLDQIYERTERRLGLPRVPVAVSA